MATQVRKGNWWRKNTRVNKAVNKGPTAMVISTLATAVSVSATMNAVNITLQQTPDSQK